MCIYHQTPDCIGIRTFYQHCKSLGRAESCVLTALNYVSKSEAGHLFWLRNRLSYFSLAPETLFVCLSGDNNQQISICFAAYTTVHFESTHQYTTLVWDNIYIYLLFLHNFNTWNKVWVYQMSVLQNVQCNLRRALEQEKLY